MSWKVEYEIVMFADGKKNLFSSSGGFFLLLGQFAQINRIAFNMNARCRFTHGLG